MKQAVRTHILFLLILLIASSGSVSAQSSDDPIRFLVWIKNDIQAAPRALVRTSPARLAGSGAAIWALSRYDESILENALGWRNRELMRVMEEMGDANAVRPLAFVLFAGSLFGSNHRFQDAAFTSLESLVLANVLTNTLKLGFGRQRPWQGDDSSVFKPFSGNTSFPSGHATTAFAAVTPWVLYYPGVFTGVLAVAAAGTALSRVPLKFHWPSDVLAGAILGTSVSAWLVRRHANPKTSTSLASRFRPSIGPSHFALTVSF